MNTEPDYESSSYYIVANDLQCLNCYATTTVWADGELNFWLLTKDDDL